MATPKTLDETISSLIGDQLRPEIVLPNLIAQRLSEQGIRLSPRNIARLKKRLKRRVHGELSIEIDDKGYPGLTSDAVQKRVQAVIDDLGPAVKKACDGVIRAIPALIDNLATTLADRAVEDIRNRKRSALASHRRQHEAFRQHMRKEWAAGLDALETQIGAITEIGARCAEQDNERNVRSGRRVRQVLRSLQARACQIAREILLLMENGYADGAHARWRSLHEVATVACVVAAKGERTAYRYLMHEVWEARRSAKAQLAAWPHLERDQEFVRQVQVLERDCSRLVAKYGPGFNSQNGWAAHLFGGRKPQFSEIEKLAQLEMLRPHYGLASDNVHAGAKGASYRLGLGLEAGLPVLLAGPSELGLEDPGILAARSLMLMTVTSLTYKADTERLVLARVALKLADDTMSAFQPAPGLPD